MRIEYHCFPPGIYDHVYDKAFKFKIAKKSSESLLLTAPFKRSFLKTQSRLEVEGIPTNDPSRFFGAIVRDYLKGKKVTNSDIEDLGRWVFLALEGPTPLNLAIAKKYWGV